MKQDNSTELLAHSLKVQFAPPRPVQTPELDFCLDFPGLSIGHGHFFTRLGGRAGPEDLGGLNPWRRKLHAPSMRMQNLHSMQRGSIGKNVGRQFCNNLENKGKLGKDVRRKILDIRHATCPRPLF